MVDAPTLFILSVFQGLFEWLPVSSEGISVYLMVNFLKLDPEPALEYAIFLHIGTMLAVLFKFRSDFKSMFESIYKGNGQLTKILLVASCSTAITAVPLMYLIKGFANGAIMNGLIGAMLIATGLILRLPSGGKRSLYELRLTEIVLLGLIQGFAIVPGISRSGVTVSFLLLRKLNEEHALKLSFLISVPAVLGAVILSRSAENVIPFSGLIVVFTTFVVGYLTMDLLLRFARKTNFSTFCISLGIISIVTTVVLMI